MLSKFIHLKVISSVLIVCLVSIPLLAQSDGSVSLDFRTNPNSPLPTGILDASNPDEVYVNGNRSQNGMTILSGANLETKSSDMLISLRDLGKIKVCAQSKLDIVFTNQQVEIKLTSGSLRLDTMSGIGGKIILPENEILVTDGNGIAITPNFAVGCSGMVGGAAPLYAPDAGIPFFGSLGAAVSVIGGAVTIAAITSNFNNDPTINSISVVQP